MANIKPFSTDIENNHKINMKTINTYINEKLRLSAKPQYTCQPEDWNKLQEIILQRIKDEGNECDLNDIDTSKIKDMSALFDTDDYQIFEYFNGDISMWDVSNVEDMKYMFHGCKQFNCDLSMWNVSNVSNMHGMFSKCEQFNSDISHWNVSNVHDMAYMFYMCEEFNQDLNKWYISNIKNMLMTFKDCPTQPDWYDKDKWEEDF